MKSQTEFLKAMALSLAAAMAVTIGLSMTETTGSAYATPAPSGVPAKEKKTDKGLRTVKIGTSKEVFKTAGGSKERQGGSNIGGGNRRDALDGISEWCTNSLSALKKARKMAAPKLLGANYEGANDVYHGGLVVAIRKARDLGYEHSLTLKAMIRINHIAERLAKTLPVNPSDNVAKTVSDFYIVAYDYIENIAKTLDIPVYIPYYSSNAKFDIRDYEKRFADYGADQIKWVLDNFTYGNTQEYFSVDFNAYMTIAEEVSAGVAADLSESVFDAAYACQIGDLQNLADDIAAYNGGDHDTFGGETTHTDKKYAVNSTVGSLKEALAALGKSCRGTY